MRKQTALSPIHVSFFPKLDKQKQCAKKNSLIFYQNQLQITIRKFAIVDFLKQKRCN